MMLRKSKLFLVGLAIVLNLPLLAQQDILKSFADTASINKYCLYASTLRMINLAQNPDYNKMVENIEKLLIYSLDSTAKKDKSYHTVFEKYRTQGYSKYASMWGGGTNFSIYGNESRTNELVGLFEAKNDLYVFYLIGMVDISKIPALLQSFNRDDMFDVFSNSGIRH